MDLSELAGDNELARAMARYGLDEELARITTEMNGLQERLDAVTATHVSPDRMVKATVNGQAVLTELELHPDVYERQDPQRLAASILITVQEAAAAASARTSAIYDEFREAQP